MPAKKKEERRPRPALSSEERRLLKLRVEISHRRPKFVRTASHRYWRIGREESWRAPKGVQSKQRRHYGYRPTVVSIGFGGPATMRGRTTLGLWPIIVHNTEELEGLDPTKQTVVIAHGVGTRKRLIIEEAARKKNLHVANPLGTGGGDEE